ncbi:hypothetical protein IFM89_024425 [Coptis chinensis]|uniref:Uncharacterized protein n=1 Tax=Coptis chinensis TaxID=261450 RepID=A0A835HPG9_9MAGN|nr:hypothetical protein IFM89_024425 [Coptis chinensis]
MKKRKITIPVPFDLLVTTPKVNNNNEELVELKSSSSSSKKGKKKCSNSKKEVSRPPLIRTSRGRVQALPSRFSDSVMIDPWKKDKEKESNNVESTSKNVGVVKKKKLREKEKGGEES